jgi:glycosyltransferase involved in cell wall biosynthesis
MPVRDGARYLAAAIASVQTQTYRQWELIVVDNGSTDESAEIAHGIASRDRRIRVITGVSGDRARAKNVGVEHARCELVARMDADDVAVPERLAVQLAWLDRTGADVCGGWVARFGDADGLLGFPETHHAIERELLFRSALIGPTVMTRREVLAQHPYSESAVFKDYELWTRLVSRYRMTNVPAVLLRYRCHPQQTSVLESDDRRRESHRLSAALFAHLFPDAGREDVRVIGKLVAGEAFAATEELEHAGAWLARLAEGPDVLLRLRMLERWRDACRRSAHLGSAAYRSYARLAPAFGVDGADSDGRLRAACALRARGGSRRDRGLRGLTGRSSRVRATRSS